MENQHLTPEQDALEHIMGYKDKPFLEERRINPSKGRGVFAQKAIAPSSFVVEYRGTLSLLKKRARKMKCGDVLKNYQFDFDWKGSRWSIDGSMEDKTFGRLVNDDHINPNCEMRKIDWDGEPHLCLFALKQISPGEEITFNYGKSSYPWRALMDAAASFESFCKEDDDDELSENEASQNEPSQEDNSKSASQLDSREDSSSSDCESSHENDKTYEPLDDSLSEGPDDDNDDDHDAATVTLDTDGNKSNRRTNYCYVCGKGNTKITRHLHKHAHAEPDIAACLRLPKNSKERKERLRILRNKGNFKHNQEVLRSNRGELKMNKMSLKGPASAKTHKHCLYCQGLFLRVNMWRHVAKCPMRQISVSESGSKKSVLSEMALAESQLTKNLPAGVLKLLFDMKQDEIACAVQNDLLLLKLAQHLFERHTKQTINHDYIRQKLREMGRLLLALLERSILSFEEAIKAANFNQVVECVKEIAGFNENSQNYQKPRLALRLGHSLKKIATIALIGVECNEEMTNDTNTFMKLCAKEWSELVSETATASLSEQKIIKPSTIPFTQDMQQFYTYLEKTSASAMEGLLLEQSPTLYNALCRVTLVQATVINKCAPEVSKLTLQTFQERDESTTVLSKHFMKINTSSATGENVAVLLTSELVSAIMLLASKREACGVHRDNPFLFAKPNSSPRSLFYGRICIRAFSRMCNVKHPEYLRSVHLHKHIARVFQVLNLENDELEHLSKILGHEIKADKDYYRKPEAAVDLAKIAKLLLEMEKGSLQTCTGNSLEEVEIEDELEPDVEQNDEQAEAENEESMLFPEKSDGLELDEEQDTEQLDAEEEKEQTEILPEQSEAAAEEDAVVEDRRRVEDALEHIKSGTDKPFLEGIFIDPFKGRGVFTNERIEANTFVVEYRGNITASETETRRRRSGVTLNNYVFDFWYNGTNWSIDASKEDKTLGRLVNDDHVSPNCKIRKIVLEGTPHLCLFAVRAISAGEEITYNYGSSSYRWRAMDVDSAGSSISGESGCDDDDEYVPGHDTSSDDEENIPHNETISDDDFTHIKEKKKTPPTDEFDRDSSKNRKSSEPLNVNDASNNEDAMSSDDFTSDGEHEAIQKDTRTGRLRSTNYCYVCGKPQSKISRHLFTHRKKDAEIAKVFALAPHCKERSALLDEMRKKGNHEHNQKVLRDRCGELKVKKRFSSIKTFTVCLYCKSMYSRKDMWRHMQKCASKKDRQAECVNRDDYSSDVMKLLKSMKDDDVTKAVCNDSYTLQLAQRLCCQYKGKKTKHHEMSICLRVTGRILLTLRERSSVCSFEEAVRPENFNKVLECVRELYVAPDDKKAVLKPTLVPKVAIALKKIAQINLARVESENADQKTVADAQMFMTLCRKEWRFRNDYRGNLNKPKTVQFVIDVQKFCQFMVKTASSAMESLTKYECKPVYDALLRVTVAQVCVLNKSMVDVSKITLKSFLERDESETQENPTVPQSELDQILSPVRINAESESGIKMAVTLTPEIFSAINLLVEKREACGVHGDNPFLFGCPVDIPTSIFVGHTCINMFLRRCSVENTTHLRNVFFWKRVKRIFQILALTGEDLDKLANLLGRDIRTEREFYQTEEAGPDIAKMAELISAVESGTLEKFNGKSFKEIEIPEELEPDGVERSNEPDRASESEEENGELDNSVLSGISSSNTSAPAKKRAARASSAAKNRRGRPRARNESENDDVSQKSVPREEDNINVNTGEGVSTPKSRTPKTVSRVSSSSSTVKKKGRRQKSRYRYESDESNPNDDVESNKKAPDKDNHFNAEEDKDVETNVGQKDLDMNTNADNNSSEEMPGQNIESSTGEKDMNHLIAGTDHGMSAEKDEATQSNADKKKELKMATETTTDKGSSLNANTDVETNRSAEDSWEEMPEGFDVQTPTTSHFDENKTATKMSFSDSDGDEMNVDFDMDIDTDDDVPNTPNNNPGNPADLDTTVSVATASAPNGMHDRAEENQDEDDSNGREPEKKDGRSNEKESDVVPGLDDTMEPDGENCVVEEEKESENKQSDGMDSESKSSSEVFDTEKWRKFSAAFPGMKDVKILIPKLDVKLQELVHISKLASLACNLPKKEKVSQKTEKSQPAQIEKDDGPESSSTSSIDPKNKQKDAKAVDMSCSHCKKLMVKGQTAFQKKGFWEVFCSKNCLFEKFPVNKQPAKTCHLCLKPIANPVDLIMAAVDTKGTMKDFCSVDCLCSFKSHKDKPPASVCSKCNKSCAVLCERNVNGTTHKFCSESCLEGFRDNAALVCDNCHTSLRRKRPLFLNLQDQSKNICSTSCLDEFKRNIKTFLKCRMCKICRPTSAMTHSKNDYNVVELFCGRLCSKAYKNAAVAQVQASLTNERNRERPSIQKADSENSKTISDSTVKEHSSNAVESDSGTETVSKSLSSTAKNPHVEVISKQCYNCFQVITRPRQMIRAPVDGSGTLKDLCGNDCLASLNSKITLKNAHRTRCGMCQKLSHCTYRQTLDGSSHRFCSESCFIDYHRQKKLPAAVCECCGSLCLHTPLLLQTDGGNKCICSDPCLAKYKETSDSPQQCVLCRSLHRLSDMLEDRNEEGTMETFCSYRCLQVHRAHSVSGRSSPSSEEQDIKEVKPPLLNVIKEEPVFEDSKEGLNSEVCTENIKDEPLGTKKSRTCVMCSSARPLSEMIENRNSEKNVSEFFCSYSCVIAGKIQTVNTAGVVLSCAHCSKVSLPACHLAMSDHSITSFCSLSCAMAFKDTQKKASAASKPTAASNGPTQSDLRQTQISIEALPVCAQCKRILRTTPKVVQDKGQMSFLCSASCSEAFRNQQQMVGKCEFCKNRSVITSAKRIDNKDCFFCSDDCKMFFSRALDKFWGVHCHSCSFCLSASKTLIKARYLEMDEEFCSEECHSKYNKLFSHLSECDQCGREGKLRQSLPLLGEVKHFCDLRCVLHFCNRQMNHKVRPPPDFENSAESSPVISNVMSLAAALAQRNRQNAANATQQASLPNIPRNVVAHASVQTDCREQKNKAMMVAPLVHNKGVSCQTATTDTGTQTDNFFPTMMPFPVPVPVYVPLPLNLCSQLTPKPLPLPLPFPVPLVVPVPSDILSVKPTKKNKRARHKSNEEERNIPSVAKSPDQRDRLVTPDPSSDDDEGEDEEYLPTLPLVVEQTAERVSNKNKGRKIQQQQQPSTEVQSVTSLNKEVLGSSSTPSSRTQQTLNSLYGVNAWKRWTQWRRTQANTDHHSLDLNEDVLLCCGSDLSVGLCLFISEVKRPDGEPYPPDSLFYLCLGIQQYLFENGRLENIFSDPNYKRFSLKFTKILKGFKPSITASGYVHSRVEEDFLWDCKQLGAYSPIVLLNTLLFFFCKFFGFTSAQQHRQLSFAQLTRCTKTSPTNNTKTSYLRFCLPGSVEEQEDTEGVPSKRRRTETELQMQENTENPLRCPVRLYRFYLSKCPECVRWRSDVFYLSPDRRSTPVSAVWFSSAPLDDITLEAGVTRSLAVRELQERTEQMPSLSENHEDSG